MAAFTVSSLWRYPVKSMAGEELNAVDVTASGLRGDRAYALVDTASGKVGSAKNVRRFGELLKYQAKFVTQPESEGVVPAVRITLPDAQVAVAAAFGSQVSLRSTAPDGLMLEFAPGTLGGKYAKVTEVPVAGAAPRGTLFDYACVHILTTSALQRLREAYPEGQFSVERFRPNIAVDCAGESGFVENSWVGHTLAIGREVILRVSIPCPRCVMTTLPRLDLSHDPKILRIAVQLNTQNLGDFGNLPCVGVYADVVKPGRIRHGDPVRVSS
jgi:uncharacterized protein YcbX